MIIDLPDDVAFKMLDVLRLDPIYIFLHISDDNEHKAEWIPDDFRPDKWYGYEHDHAELAYDCFLKLLGAMQASACK